MPARAGPAEPTSAAAIVVEAAAALAVAPAAGLAHLCLEPGSLWWDTPGEVMIAGLSIGRCRPGARRPRQRRL
jgi:hypothetical protein